MAVESELRRRRKLEDVNTVEDVVKLIQESKNIIILAGAGSMSQEVVAYNRDKYVLWDSRF